jgi:hypothetical protein
MMPLVPFYMVRHPDHRGRYLAEILSQSDDWLEVTHDYIQWLFPNRCLSGVLPNAPLPDKETVELFYNDDILQDHLQASLNRILRLTDRCLVKQSNWVDRRANWFLHNTHNTLRIIRILLCLAACGCNEKTKQIHTGLLQLRKTEPDCGLSENPFHFWQKSNQHVSIDQQNTKVLSVL